MQFFIYILILVISYIADQVIKIPHSFKRAAVNIYFTSDWKLSFECHYLCFCVYIFRLYILLITFNLCRALCN
jgi:hypothetical protein